MLPIRLYYFYIFSLPSFIYYKYTLQIASLKFIQQKISLGLNKHTRLYFVIKVNIIFYISFDDPF